jgi:hypothetical protein
MSDDSATHFGNGGLARLASDEAPVVIDRPDGRWEAVRNPTHALVVEQLQDFLAREEHSIIMWEDPLQSGDDPDVRGDPSAPLFFVGNDVYYVLGHRMATPAAIEEGLSRMVAWWGSPAIMATLSDDIARPLLIPQASVTADEQRPPVAHLRSLFFLAYDGEGFVWWSPQAADDARHIDSEQGNHEEIARPRPLPCEGRGRG